MKRLRDYAAGAGQWGEGGMIHEMECRTGITISTAVEFGAGDDPALLNTLELAERGAICLWAEADPNRYAKLGQIVVDHAIEDNVVLQNTMVAAIDTLIDGWPLPDLISIDVDGYDYDLFDGMEAHPPFVIIEHNPTVPPEVHWIGHGPGQGASAAAIAGLAWSKGYRLVGATTANLFLVDSDLVRAFHDLERSLLTIFDRSQLNYVVSDYKGDYAMTGPWAFGRGMENRDLLEASRT